MRTPGVPASTAAVDSSLPGSIRASGSDDSALDSALIDRSFDKEPLSRWMGWRLRLLVVAALLGCLAILLLARALGDTPQLPASWHVGEQQRLELMSSSDPLLKPHEGSALVALVSSSGQRIELEALTLWRSTRWLIDDTQRERHIAMQQGVASALQQGKVSLVFTQGETVEITPQARGIGSLGPMFWLLCGLSLAMYLVAMVVMLARPTLRNLLYTTATLCQAGKLGLMAIESSMGLALSLPTPLVNLQAHTALDLVTGAAVMHATALHPRRLPAAGTIGWLVWAGATGLLWHLNQDTTRAAWWWLQSGVATLGLGAVALLTWSHTIEPHPFAIVMRRFASLGVGAWVALTLAFAWSAHHPLLQQQIAVLGPTLWSVFLGSLLVLLPFLSKSQQVMREFSLLAAISTIATALDLLFVAAFSLGQFASLTLALFLSLGLYSGARQWLLNQLRHQNVITTERVFEKLYRIAREVEAHPERTSNLLTQLLRELFQPIEAGVIDKPCPATRVSGNGSTLLIPVPDLPHSDALEHATIVIRFAHHGHRLFTTEDARLAERVVEQLRRAVAFDQAVEQGRNEERLRIAQDLHDDIGARLLTLMYKAQSPEMEDYVRHTLQDLKTLTRGLAAPNHPLSHAAAEWKADLTQRLNAAHIALGWSFSADCELSLSVVQWSALTRVMRELVSNVISHSQARRVDIEFLLEGDRLDLSVSDNGVGRAPQAWSHGLGLGGVRKRVKQLGGEVEWREVDGGGICCRVCIRQLSRQPFDKA
jgi:signal transduction histidine kinase